MSENGDWCKGDTVTLKGWQISHMRGTVMEIRPGGFLLIRLQGGTTILKSVLDVHSKTEKKAHS